MFKYTTKSRCSLDQALLESAAAAALAETYKHASKQTTDIYIHSTNTAKTKIQSKSWGGKAQTTPTHETKWSTQQVLELVTTS